MAVMGIPVLFHCYLEKEEEAFSDILCVVIFIRLTGMPQGTDCLPIGFRGSLFGKWNLAWEAQNKCHILKTFCLLLILCLHRWIFQWNKEKKKSTTISSCISMIERKVTGKYINITFFSTFSLPLSLHPSSFLCAIQEADAEKRKCYRLGDLHTWQTLHL